MTVKMEMLNLQGWLAGRPFLGERPRSGNVEDLDQTISSANVKRTSVVWVPETSQPTSRFCPPCSQEAFGEGFAEIKMLVMPYGLHSMQRIDMHRSLCI